ncbi:hypothetical protein [Haloferula sargassicola]|uniref:Cox cluster protein n=1 Tax=Haloferula sargassicola TaxID=490096 RepID=A0ABP9UM35_9BACT
MDDERETPAKPPDWDSFETWTGEEEREPWWAPWFHRAMIAFSLLLVFLISGVLFWLGATRSAIGREMLLEESGRMSLTRFIIGGGIGVVAVLVVYFKRPRPPAI